MGFFWLYVCMSIYIYIYMHAHTHLNEWVEKAIQFILLCLPGSWFKVSITQTSSPSSGSHHLSLSSIIWSYDVPVQSCHFMWPSTHLDCNPWQRHRQRSLFFFSFFFYYFFFLLIHPFCLAAFSRGGCRNISSSTSSTGWLDWKTLSCQVWKMIVSTVTYWKCLGIQGGKIRPPATTNGHTTGSPTYSLAPHASYFIHSLTIPPPYPYNRILLLLLLLLSPRPPPSIPPSMEVASWT